MRKVCNLVIAILLTGFLLFSFGCTHRPQPTSLPQEEAPTLEVMVIGGSNSSALQRISEAISNITLEKLGCRISLTTVNLSEYQVHLNQLQIDGALPDLFVSESKDMLSQLIAENQVICLDSYLPQYSALVNEISNPTEWRNVEFSGRVFAIPFNNNQEYHFAFTMRADICDELGIDANSISTLDQLHDILVRVKNAYPDVIPVVPNYSVLSPAPWWDTLSNEVGMTSVGVLPYRDTSSSSLELITDLPEFWVWCSLMYGWAQDGLIMENACFNQEPRQTLLNTGIAFGSFTRYTSSTAINQAINQTDPPYYAILTDNRIDYSDNGSAFCISSNSSEPDLCLAFLQLLYTDTELLSLCTYGQEGYDYMVHPDGSLHANLSADDRYVITRWCWPNTRRLDAPTSDTFEIPTNTVISPAAGFWFDPSTCHNEFTACKELLRQYYPALMSGMLDPETAIPKLRQALIEAGALIVLAEQQRQLDAWILEPY